MKRKTPKRKTSPTKLRVYEVAGTVTVTVDIEGAVHARNRAAAVKRMQTMVQRNLLQDRNRGDGESYILDGIGPWEWTGFDAAPEDTTWQARANKAWTP